MITNMTRRHKAPDGAHHMKGAGLRAGDSGGLNSGEALPDAADGADKNPLHDGGSDTSPRFGGNVSPHDVDIANILNQLESDVTGNFSAPHPACDACMAYAVRPDNPGRLMWDCYILMLVVYSSIQGPFTVAFSEKEDYTALDVMIDVSFYVDIVLSFWTGFDKGFEVIMEKKAIIKNYVEGWFLLDLIATVQWDLVIQATGTGIPADSPMIRLSRLLKVFRLARASRLISRITATWTIHTAFIEAAKFFFYVGMVAHLLACFFFMWPTLFVCNRDIESVALELPGVYTPSGLGFVDTGDVELSGLVDGWESLLAEWRTDVSNASVNLAVEDGMDSIAALADGTGWYWYGSCMQNSWRQSYGLEDICYVDPIGDGTATVSRSNWGDSELALLWDCYTTKATAADHKYTKADGTKLPVRKVCIPCMRPMRLYIDSVYWSLTTMTTIGYGDRGPSTEEEILFVLFAEIFGLCVFALLLTQINTLGDVLGERENKKNEEKNGVVQFLKNQDVPDALVHDTVRFMNFRSTSLSGHAFHAENDQFSMLSPGLIEAIQNAVYRPVLENVRFFGWNKADDREHQKLEQIFNEIDLDGSGSLSQEKTASVFKAHGMVITDGQMGRIFHDMDQDRDGSVTFTEFVHWWFLRKTGKPRITRCPSGFLDALCTKLQTQPFAIDEEIVHPGDYGKSLIILLSGSAEIERRETSGQAFDFGPDGIEREPDHELVTHKDHEPVIGFAACLGHSQWQRVRNNTSTWTVLAKTYIDTAWIARKDIITCFEATWSEGQLEMEEIAFYHYEVSENPVGDTSPRSNGQTSPSVPPLDLDVELPASADLGQLSADLSQRIARVEKNVDAKMDQVLAALQEVTRKVDKLAGDGDGPSSPATRMLSSDSAV